MVRGGVGDPDGLPSPSTYSLPSAHGALRQAQTTPWELLPCLWTSLPLAPDQSLLLLTSTLSLAPSSPARLEGATELKADEPSSLLPTVLCPQRLSLAGTFVPGILGLCHSDPVTSCLGPSGTAYITLLSGLPFRRVLPAHPAPPSPITKF